MNLRNEEAYNRKRNEIMEKCFNCYAENGLSGVGLSTVAKACGCTKSSLYNYFADLDELITASTEYCMSRVEDEFLAKAPQNTQDIVRFIDEIPYWTAREHGAKYRLMYQIYTHPKYREHGKKFFEGVNRRYSEYAKQLEEKINIPHEIITSLIFIFVRACVHYALFEDEYYLLSQLKTLKLGIAMYLTSEEQTD